MLERVIENWLDKASERSFQKPFCDMLSAKGHTIVHLTRHCGMELGKDVLSIDPDGVPCAFQLKGAGGSRISLKRWNEGLHQQAFNLVVNSISHPSIPSTPHHKAYFVTNGMLEEEVSAAIKQQNDQSANQGMSHLQLRTIVRGELISDAKSLEAGLWPTEIADFKALLEMYLHRGDGPLPKNEFAALLASLVPGYSDLRPVRPRRWRNEATLVGASSCRTRSRSPTSIPSSRVLVATITQSRDSRNARSACLRSSTLSELWLTKVFVPAARSNDAKRSAWDRLRLQLVLAQGDDLTHAAKVVQLAEDLSVQSQDLAAQVQRAKDQASAYAKLTTTLLASLTTSENAE